MIRDPATWLANATVDDIIWAVFLAAIGIGFMVGCAAYWYRHRGEP